GKLPHVTRHPAFRVRPLVLVPRLPGGRHTHRITIEGEPLGVADVVEEQLMVATELPFLVWPNIVVPHQRVAPRQAHAVQTDLEVAGPFISDLHEERASWGEDVQDGSQPSVGEVEVRLACQAVMIAGITEPNVEGGIGEGDIGTPRGQGGKDGATIADED